MRQAVIETVLENTSRPVKWGSPALHEETLSVISLFSGCGGLDLGLHGGFDFLGKKYPNNKFKIIWANDINPAATQTFRLNFPETPVTTDDITKVLVGDFEVPRADIVVGGFPCQDFSLAGKRKGLEVKRGQLYRSMVDVVKKSKPKAFIAENVKGLMSWMDGLAIKTIKNDFSRAGYNVEYRLLNTANYGVPQTRERIIIVGMRKDLKKKFIWPKQTHAQNPSKDQQPWVTIRQALADLEDDMSHFRLANSGYSKAKLFPGTQGNTITKSDRPSPTMRAEHHGNIEFHYSKQRRLSAREAARIQSFPDNFVFYKSTSDTYRQVGNAVAPVFGWHLGRALQDSLS